MKPHYRRWQDMLRRCYSKNRRDYPHYGGRGIRVCDDWLDFEAFQAWCFETYEPGKSLDRVNNDGPYAPDNCRWATKSEQRKNSRKGTPAQKKAHRILVKAASAHFAAIYGDPRRRKKKPCNYCEKTLALSEFTRDKNSPDGVKYTCRACSIFKIRKYRGTRETLSR
jgi:hypothetical protein